MKHIFTIAFHATSISMAAATLSNTTYHAPTLSSPAASFPAASSPAASSPAASSTLVPSTISSAPPTSSSCTPLPGDQNYVVNGGFGDPYNHLINWNFTREGNANPGDDYSSGSTVDTSNTAAFFVFIREGTGRINFTQPVCLRPNAPYRLSYDLGIDVQSNTDPGNTGCVVTPYLGDRPQYIPVAPCGDAQAPQDRGDCNINGYSDGSYYYEFVLAAFAPRDVSDTLLRFVFDCDVANISGTGHSVVLDNIALIPVI